MEREDAKDLTLSILVIAVVLLIADCVWLHVKCAGQAAAIEAQKAKIAECAARLEAHINPPPEPTVADKAKAAYEKAKDATVKGYESAKDSTVKGYQKVKAAAKAGYEAAKAEYNK